MSTNADHYQAQRWLVTATDDLRAAQVMLEEGLFAQRFLEA